MNINGVIPYIHIEYHMLNIPMTWYGFTILYIIIFLYAYIQYHSNNITCMSSCI